MSAMMYGFFYRFVVEKGSCCFGDYEREKFQIQSLAGVTQDPVPSRSSADQRGLPHCHIFQDSFTSTLPLHYTARQVLHAW